jgi:hypothetical protein
VQTTGRHRAITTPFDTGGLAQGHIHTRPESPGLAELVRQANVPVEQHQEALNTWVDAAYPPGDYRADEKGSRPPQSPVASILLTADTDDRGWTWEGRIVAADYDQLPLTVRRVYLKPEAIQHYWDWLEERTPLEPDALPPHEDLFDAVSVAVDSPYEAMMEDLGGRIDA